MIRRIHIRLAALLAVVSLGACANMPSMHSALGVAVPMLTPQERVHAAMDLLQRGEEQRAKEQLEATLRAEPGNATAKRLLDEITIDPRTQLGERNHSYIVHNGETMSTLAERFLGDPLMFYALARYNNIAPDHLAAGQTLLIPDRGRPVTTASVRSPSAPQPAPPVAVAPAPVATNAVVAARANRLRLQGLERLNAGDADSAVNLLQQAAVIDSGNAAIQRDLSRAQRIQASLRASN